MSDELVMYIVINKEVDMGKGKIVSQAGHVMINLALELVDHNPGLLNNYIKNGLHPKIVLKATLLEMQTLLDKYPNETVFVRDAGRTQIPANTLTAIAFYPATKNKYPELSHLRLL
jgi:PTH2 family peptidyl-tRNA hydrolase